MTNRFPRRAKKPPRARQSRRQIFAVLAIAATLALGAIATDGFVMALQRQTVAAAPSDDDIYTGSILLPAGEVCRQLLFDNQSGRVTDNGNVDCERAAYNGLDGPKQWSAARIRVIATGFREH